MCGVCGIVNFDQRPVNPGILKRMADLLIHRGPDDNGAVFLSQVLEKKCKPIKFKDFDELRPINGLIGYNIGFGHRRLSIIDLSEAGCQPMSNEDGTIWITYNGEIYNYREISDRLKVLGHRFKSNSDTEVIIHSYEEWGEECLERFRGFFAFAVWDANKKLLFLARDRVGKKPLFFYTDQDKFIFSSSLKSILINPGIHKNINLEIIHDFLTYGYNPTNQTIFKGINKLPPAHLLICKNGKIDVKKYWDLADSYNSEHRSYNIRYFNRRLLELLEETVKLRLVSDVPLGAFLSGGIDSSAIVGMMSKLMDEPVKTFSIGFDDESFNELKYARQVAEYFKTEHYEFMVTPKAFEVLPELIWHCDEPFADSSILPTYYLSKMTKKYVTVALNGDGGDESFAGYESHIGEKLVTFYQMIPPVIRNQIIRRIPNDYFESTRRIDLFRRWKRFMEKADIRIGRREWRWIFSNDMKEEIYSDSFKKKVKEIDSLILRENEFFRITNADLTTRLLNLDIRIYLPEDLLVKADRASMANSLEVRSPFLDHHLMEFAASMPANLKFRGFTTKYVLKRALENFLPKKIIHRYKQGFGVPLGNWFRGELKDFSYQVLMDERATNRNYFKKEKIRSLLDGHCSGKHDYGHKIWALLVLELWHQQFVDKDGFN